MDRNTSITIGRVVATIFILLCHIVQFYIFIPGHSILAQFFNVGVPMFFIISGYLYGNKNESYNKEFNTKRFFKERYFRVVLPSQIWALIVFVFSLGKNLLGTIIVLLNLQGINWIIKDVGFPDGGIYLSHSWFVTVILLCYFLIPILYRYVNQIQWWHIFFMYVSCIVFSFIHINLFFIVLFIVSYYLGYKRFHIENINVAICILIIFLSVIVRIIGQRFFDGTILYNEIIVGITHQLLAFSILTLIVVLNEKYTLLKKIDSSKVLKHIEKHSYSIYLVHYCLISFTYKCMNLFFASVVFFILTFALSFMLDFITNKIIAFVKKTNKRNETNG